MTAFALAALGLVAGAGLGIFVTRRLHRRVGGWGARLGRSRFRRANLPVGGSCTLVLTLTLPTPGVLVPVLLGASAAMAATAIGWRYVDPLPPA